jgi:hypothetical protein
MAIDSLVPVSFPRRLSRSRNPGRAGTVEGAGRSVQPSLVYIILRAFYLSLIRFFLWGTVKNIYAGV